MFALVSRDRIELPAGAVVKLPATWAEYQHVPYRVPECWFYKREQLHIYQLQAGTYELKAQSKYFPTYDLHPMVARCLEIAYGRNTSAAIRDLRSRLS